eukprot:234559_1
MSSVDYYSSEFEAESGDDHNLGSKREREDEKRVSAEEEIVSDHPCEPIDPLSNAEAFTKILSELEPAEMIKMMELTTRVSEAELKARETESIVTKKKVLAERVASSVERIKAAHERIAQNLEEAAKYDDDFDRTVHGVAQEPFPVPPDQPFRLQSAKSLATVRETLGTAKTISAKPKTKMLESQFPEYSDNFDEAAGTDSESIEIEISESLERTADESTDISDEDIEIELVEESSQLHSELSARDIELQEIEASENLSSESVEIELVSSAQSLDDKALKVDSAAEIVEMTVGESSSASIEFEEDISDRSEEEADQTAASVETSTAIDTSLSLEESIITESPRSQSTELIELSIVEDSAVTDQMSASDAPYTSAGSSFQEDVEQTQINILSEIETEGAPTPRSVASSHLTEESIPEESDHSEQSSSEGHHSSVESEVQDISDKSSSQALSEIQTGGLPTARSEVSSQLVEESIPEESVHSEVIPEDSVLSERSSSEEEYSSAESVGPEETNTEPPKIEFPIETERSHSPVGDKDRSTEETDALVENISQSEHEVSYSSESGQSMEEDIPEDESIVSEESSEGELRRPDYPEPEAVVGSPIHQKSDDGIPTEISVSTQPTKLSETEINISDISSGTGGLVKDKIREESQEIPLAETPKVSGTQTTEDTQKIPSEEPVSSPLKPTTPSETEINIEPVSSPLKPTKPSEREINISDSPSGTGILVKDEIREESQEIPLAETPKVSDTETTERTPEIQSEEPVCSPLKPESTSLSPKQTEQEIQLKIEEPISSRQGPLRELISNPDESKFVENPA